MTNDMSKKKKILQTKNRAAIFLALSYCSIAVGILNIYLVRHDSVWLSLLGFGFNSMTPLGRMKQPFQVS